MLDILSGTNLFEVIFQTYRFIHELFNSRCHLWCSCDVPQYFWVAV